MAAGRSARAVIGAGLLMVTLAACGGGERPGFGPDGVPIENFTAEQIFERGEFELDRRDPEDAAFYFSEVERLYPYSELAKRAVIMQAFAHHQNTRLEEDVTVKRFKRDGKKIVLLPENPDFEPIVVDPSQDFLAIEGLAVGVIRNPRSGL